MVMLHSFAGMAVVDGSKVADMVTSPMDMNSTTSSWCSLCGFNTAPLMVKTQHALPEFLSCWSVYIQHMFCLDSNENSELELTLEEC